MKKDDIVDAIFNEKQLNGAILPEYIYTTESIIKIDKELLMLILEEENKIRKSSVMRDMFDDNPMTKYAELDRHIIKSSLVKAGFDPDNDDSLKAYHLATGKFINDPEVKEKVVWMKYDKARIGNNKPGDHIKLERLYVYNKALEKIELKDLFVDNKPNIIVADSLS
jgi:hypothetical protein